MTVELAQRFLKAYKKRIQRNRKLDRQMARRVELFKANSMNPILQDHPLKGTKLGLRAFSITGDVRIIYQPQSPNHVIFVDIGTHNQVYV